MLIEIRQLRSCEAAYLCVEGPSMKRDVREVCIGYWLVGQTLVP